MESMKVVTHAQDSGIPTGKSVICMDDNGWLELITGCNTPVPRPSFQKTSPPVCCERPANDKKTRRKQKHGEFKQEELPKDTTETLPKGTTSPSPGVLVHRMEG